MAGTTDFRNRRVTIMGLGHFGGGVAAARWLARQGAAVTVSDRADEATLADSLAALGGEPIAHYHLGGHREDDFRCADLVVVNPAVRPDDRLLQVARHCGARISSEIALFMEACPAPILGVTGSNGKSTTAAMIAAILQAEGRTAWLGGNIGGSLLENMAPEHHPVSGGLSQFSSDENGTVPFPRAVSGGLSQFSSDENGTVPFPRHDKPWIRAGDWVVLELSSFQLWHLPVDARMPHVAVVTGCTPNHLDWHGSLAHYAAAKQRILTGQTGGDLAVLNTRDAEVAAWQRWVRGCCLTPWLSEIPPLRLPGEHNRINAACAAAAAAGVGCSAAAIRQGLQSFRGLPQRLERLAVVDGRRFYNDSTATTPESTIAALDSLSEPLWLLAGGHDKGFDFDDLAGAIVRRTRGTALFGSAREQLRGLIVARAPQFPCTAVESLGDALDWCWQRSRPGEAIVLSPACASTDQFRNFQQRGVKFNQLVAALDKNRNAAMKEV